MISVKNLKKTYFLGGEEVHALDDVSLSIKEHEFVAIIGQSGSGKSTFMNMLGCLDRPDSGEITLDGTDILKCKEKELSVIRNKKIGFIFQQFHLLPKLSALENVELPLIYQGMPTKKRREKAVKALKAVGLEKRMNHKPNQLSGGQQQRVAIARALVGEPSLILADEPTGNLDSRSGKEIMMLLHNLYEEGNTIVLITHDNNVAMEAPRQVQISDGKIIKIQEVRQNMKITQAIKMAFASICSTKLRSFLTMLGIIIGVMSVTVLVSIVQSTTNNVSDTLSQLGGNVISATVTSRRSNKITTSDIKSLENNPAIESVSPIISGSSTAKASGNSSSVTLKGITEEYEDIQNISVQKGRYILDVDNDNRLQVCLIGVTAAKDLFGHTDVEGETIRISGRNFKIIGVLEEDGSSQRDSNDSVIYTPFTTAQRIMQNSTISSFYVSATNEGMLNMAESAVDSFLLEKTGDEDSYTITNQSDIADSVSDVTNSMTYMIGGIAGISLLVGGIGIMNIMLVSVTERTKEIGIRKAIGAKKKDILAQFMIESTVLSCMGGVIGIALSAATIFGMNQLMSADYTISAGISLIALAFSAILGIVFGLYPANKAANLKPIEALNL